MNIKYKLFVIFFIISIITYSQNNNYCINGNVTDSITKQKIQFCSVFITNITDSVVKSGTITDEKGNYKICGIKAGKYNLYFSFLGYKSNYQKINVNDDINIGETLLNKDLQMLDEVEITEKVFTRSIDKLVMNPALVKLPENSSIVDLVEKIPGAVLTQDNALTILGKDVLVLVDDRPMRMSSETLMKILNNQSNNDVVKIEIMFSPPPKYIDEWEGAVINIITKKSLTNGGFGDLYSATRMGKRLSQESSIDFNYRWNKVFTYISVNSQLRNKYNIYNSEQIYNEQITIAQKSENLEKENNYFITSGIQFTLNDKSFLDIVFENNVFSNKDNINDTVLNNNTPALNVITGNNANKVFNSKEFNVFYINKFNKKTAFDIEADYSLVNSTYEQMREYNYFNANNIELNKNNTPSENEIEYIKSSFKYENEKFRFQCGIKYNETYRHNDLMFSDLTNNIWITDTLKSNIFKYNEDILSGFASFGQQLSDKFFYLLSARYFYTKQSGVSETLNIKHNNDFQNILPSAFISYSINDNNELSVSANSTISRPNFEMLNPFKYYNNPNYFIQGNPYLKVLQKNKVELIYNHEESFFATLSYQNLTNNIVLKPILNSTNSEIIGYNYQNFGKNDELKINTFYSLYLLEEKIEIGLSPALKYNILSDIDKGYNNEYLNYDINFNTDYYINEERDFRIGFYTLYTSGIISQYYEINNFLKCAMDISCSFFNNRLETSIEINDIFNAESSNYQYVIDNITYKTNNIKDSRYLRLSLSYSFSSKYLKQKDRRGVYNSEKGRIN